ncbi:hypothetical protein D3C73_1260460 [compost metagenome]
MHDLGPIFQAHLGQPGVARDARVVDQDVDGALVLFQPLHQRLARGVVADVHLVERKAAAARCFFFRPGARGAFAGVIRRDDVVAGVVQGLSDGAAQATRAARHQCCAFNRHGALLLGLHRAWPSMRRPSGRTWLTRFASSATRPATCRRSWQA